MKKLFGLLLLCVAVIFFSCKTTGAVASSAQENVTPTETEKTKNKEKNSLPPDASDDNENAFTIPLEDEDYSNNESSDETESEDESSEENYTEEIDDGEFEEDEEIDLSNFEKIAHEEMDELNSFFVEETPPVQEEEPEEEVDEIEEDEVLPEPEYEIVKDVELQLIEDTHKPAPAPAPAPAKTATPEPAPAPKTTPAPKPAETPPPVENKKIADSYDFTDEVIDTDDSHIGKAAPLIVPSRTLTVKRNQFVDIIYPGTGWIYLGEESKTNHFVFQGRKLQNDESIFTLRSKTSGTTVLHFYKNDALTGNYIDDYIEITVTEESSFDTKHILAPSYADAVPPKYQPDAEEETKEEVPPTKVEEKKIETPKPEPLPVIPATNIQQKDAEPEPKETSETVQTVIQTSPLQENEGGRNTSVSGTPSTQEEGVQTPSTENAIDASTITDSAKTLLEKAQKAYDEKRYADALKYIEQFFVVATEEFDAGLYLEGRILEAKSEVQNIKRAIEAYDTLLKNWPQSTFWRRANERSIYLKRFYIDIR